MDTPRLELLDPAPRRRPGFRSGRATRLDRRTRRALTVLLAMSVGVAVYLGLERGGLGRSSALFLGLPLVIGLAMIHSVHTRTAVGRSVQGNLIFLTLIAPMLGEASLCILMAAPLFLGGSAFVGFVSKVVGPRARALVLVLPVGLGVWEQQVAAEPLRVETVHELPGDVSAWRARVRRPSVPAERHTWWTRLGFPHPTHYTALPDGRVRVDFTPVEGWDGHWTVRALPSTEGVRFLVDEDTTKLSRWLTVESSSVDVTPAGAGRVRVRQVTTFTPILGPRVWFGWLMGHAFRDAHATALQTWREAAHVGP